MSVRDLIRDRPVQFVIQSDTKNKAGHEVPAAQGAANRSCQTGPTSKMVAKSLLGGSTMP